MSISFTRDGAIRTIAFNRPERKNAITVQMYRDLVAALKECSEDESARVAVLTGSAAEGTRPAIFCSGNDLQDFLAQPVSEDAPVLQFLAAIARFDKPLLAAVEGPAVGVGATMLLHCDLVHADNAASFSFPFVNLGICPEAGSTFLLPRIAGHARAAEKLYFGEAFSAAEAHALGIINAVLDAGKAVAHTMERATRLADRPLSALMETKRLMRMPTQEQVDRAIREEAAVFSRMLRAPAAREAMQAFLEKRPPDFSRC